MSAGVTTKSCSLPLERRIVDFGAEHAFNRVHNKLKEHYGIEIPSSLPRTITLKHAKNIEKIQSERLKLEKMDKSKKSCIISETDGSMVPIVQTDKNATDSRKGKTLKYREARLTLAHEKGSRSLVFSGTLKDVKTAGEHMACCIKKIGIDQKTQIHCVGDGAPWIAEQVEAQFGDQANYLVDFYHVCEYLAEASSTCDKENHLAWMENQKKLLKQGSLETVITGLKSHLESDEVEEKDAPVRACYRYLSNRRSQLDYKSAIDNGLPIGSGEIESAHRYIIQERLKLPGGWWLEDNAEIMLALRTHRANNEWCYYWENVAA